MHLLIGMIIPNKENDRNEYSAKAMYGLKGYSVCPDERKRHNNLSKIIGRQDQIIVSIIYICLQLKCRKIPTVL